MHRVHLTIWRDDDSGGESGYAISLLHISTTEEYAVGDPKSSAAVLSSSGEPSTAIPRTGMSGFASANAEKLGISILHGPPSGPEVEDHGLAAEVGEIDRLIV